MTNEFIQSTFSNDLKIFEAHQKQIGKSISTKANDFVRETKGLQSKLDRMKFFVGFQLGYNPNHQPTNDNDRLVYSHLKQEQADPFVRGRSFGQSLASQMADFHPNDRQRFVAEFGPQVEVGIQFTKTLERGKDKLLRKITKVVDNHNPEQDFARLYRESGIFLNLRKDPKYRKLTDPNQLTFALTAQEKNPRFRISTLNFKNESPENYGTYLESDGSLMNGHRSFVNEQAQKTITFKSFEQELRVLLTIHYNARELEARSRPASSFRSAFDVSFSLTLQKPLVKRSYYTYSYGYIFTEPQTQNKYLFYLNIKPQNDKAHNKWTVESMTVTKVMDEKKTLAAFVEDRSTPIRESISSSSFSSSSQTSISENRRKKREDFLSESSLSTLERTNTLPLINPSLPIEDNNTPPTWISAFKLDFEKEGSDIILPQNRIMIDFTPTFKTLSSSPSSLAFLVWTRQRRRIFISPKSSSSKPYIQLTKQKTAKLKTYVLLSNGQQARHSFEFLLPTKKHPILKAQVAPNIMMYLEFKNQNQIKSIVFELERSSAKKQLVVGMNLSNIISPTTPKRIDKKIQSIPYSSSFSSSSSKKVYSRAPLNSSFSKTIN